MSNELSDEDAMTAGRVYQEQIDAAKKLVVRPTIDDGEMVLVVDASALVTDEYGPSEWWLYAEEDGQWTHPQAGVTSPLAEALRAIASCYLDWSAGR